MSKDRSEDKNFIDRALDRSSSIVTKADAPKLATFLRWINIINALGLGASGFFGFITWNPAQMLTAVYVAIFGLIIFLFEMRLKKLEIHFINNLGFLTSWLGRGMFIVFCGTLSFSMGMIGIITGIFSILNGVFNIYVWNRRPDMKDFLAQDSERIRNEAIQRGVAPINSAADMLTASEMAELKMAKAVASAAASSAMASVDSKPAAKSAAKPVAKPAAAPAPAPAPDASSQV
eukprot:TRINITY_DN2668_c0_g1_i1.p1 TRINITY_DN2668_c0_g1~~TRINITY_DN2668_c0_g1_i1.p1  ORF type:complete len:258 (+),score=94.61 TRINITY_DN2668_c0_g1_i1:76-774(+)